MHSSSDVHAARRPRVFLTAEWRSLVMLNYAIDPALLQPHLPRGVKLDLWQNEALVSMVGFRFLKTRVLGVAIPFHQNYEEVNLRFYVRRRTVEGWQRGVVLSGRSCRSWRSPRLRAWPTINLAGGKTRIGRNSG